ncbi:MAG: trigger factor, partial [Propionibacteriales bacterium]|nr:trigger factor [Propionibacteriales bacterium]
ARDALAAQFVLDEIAKKEELGVDESELSGHIMRRAQQSGIQPEVFAQQVMQAGQVPMLVSEVVRGKALAMVVESAEVKDASGNLVDLKNLQPDGTVGEPAPDAGSDAGSDAGATADQDGESDSDRQ